jgi:ABC-type siderophore export system fused ATPase/permease subunit
MIVWVAICCILAFVWYRYNTIVAADRRRHHHHSVTASVREHHHHTIVPTPTSATTATNVLLLCVVGLCCLWLYFYNGQNNRQRAVWTLYLTLAVSLPLIPLLLSTDVFCATLFSPIIAWIIFAGNLGMFEYELATA